MTTQAYTSHQCMISSLNRSIRALGKKALANDKAYNIICKQLNAREMKRNNEIFEFDEEGGMTAQVELLLKKKDALVTQHHEIMVEIKEETVMLDRLMMEYGTHNKNKGKACV